jgi:hypothetical protein
MRGWNTVTGAVVAVGVTDDESILDLYRQVDAGDSEE